MVFAKEAVGTECVLIEPGAGGEAEHLARLLLETAPSALQADRADTRMIIDPLPVALLEHAKELEDVGDVGTDLIAGAVATNDDVLGHLSSPDLALWNAMRTHPHRTVGVEHEASATREPVRAGECDRNDGVRERTRHPAACWRRRARTPLRHTAN